MEEYSGLERVRSACRMVASRHTPGEKEEKGIATGEGEACRARAEELVPFVS